MTETRNVRSADGTTIAFHRSGTGPALILVDAAGCHHDFGSLRPVAELLAAGFTLFTYDRRGRGASTDTPPYAIEREVDDIAALVSEAGGSACLYGNSSGALLALHAAAAGLPLPRLALFEPPIGGPAGDTELIHALAKLLAADQRWQAAERFLEAIGVPPEIVTQMDPTNRAALAAAAPTLLYDCQICNETTLDLVTSVTTPTLVLDSQGSTSDLTRRAASVARALPNGTHRTLAGEWHGVPDRDLAQALEEFLTGRHPSGNPKRRRTGRRDLSKPSRTTR